MHSPSTISVSAVIAGAFIGAGFVSGQELWQFYGAFGKAGLFFLLFSMSLLFLLCAGFCTFCKKTNNFSLENSVFPNASSKVNTLFALIEVIFYFCLCTIMTSGFISLIDGYFGKTVSFLAGAVFTAVAGVCIFFGFGALVKLFSFFVPILVVLTLIISFNTLIKNGVTLPTEESTEDAVSKSPLVASLLSVSYNFFGSVGILAPLSLASKSLGQLKRASFIGIFSLFFIALCIILSIFSTETCDSALPFLDTAKKLSPVWGVFYSLLLSGAMFSCTFSSGVCVFDWVKQKIKLNTYGKIIFLSVFCTSFFVLGKVGFSNLVSTVYPAFGYIGFIVILAVLFNCVHKRRKKNV